MEVKIESLESQLLNKETIIKQNYEAKTSNYDKVDMLETLLKEEKSKVKKLEEKI